MKVVSLTRRQEQISGLISCGMAKKEIADMLSISESTVDNTLRAVYEKTGFGKINELTGWWISRRFNIAIDFKALRQQMIALSLLAMISFQIATDHHNILRARRARRPKRENETEFAIIND